VSNLFTGGGGVFFTLRLGGMIVSGVFWWVGVFWFWGGGGGGLGGVGAWVCVDDPPLGRERAPGQVAKRSNEEPTKDRAGTQRHGGAQRHQESKPLGKKLPMQATHTRAKTKTTLRSNIIRKVLHRGAFAWKGFG